MQSIPAPNYKQTLLSMLPVRRSEILQNSTEAGKIRVDFSVYVQIQEIPCLNQFTYDECAKCWCSEEEKYLRTRARHKLLEKIDSGSRKIARGLESHTRKGHRKMNKAITACLYAVLAEQEEQGAMGYSDPECIANLSSRASQKSAAAALEQATQDVWSARKAYRSMGTSKEELNSLDIWPARKSHRTHNEKRRSRRSSRKSENFQRSKSDKTIELDDLLRRIIHAEKLAHDMLLAHQSCIAHCPKTPLASATHKNVSSRAA